MKRMAITFIALLLAGCASAPPRPKVLVVCPEPLEPKLLTHSVTGDAIAYCRPPLRLRPSAPPV